MTLLLAAALLPTIAQNASEGAISAEMLGRFRAAFANTPADRAARNAMGAADINKLALNQQNQEAFDHSFSTEVKSKGITDQKQSGRCWLFSSLNVLRAKAIARYGLPEFQFSQAYLFFYDQLEKSNLFLQSVIDTRRSDFDSPEVSWLFQNPIADGGTFAGAADLVTKYGLVPREAMHESLTANSTSRLSMILSMKLRQGGIALREMADNKATAAQLQARKEETLRDVYRILCLTIGTPPESFSYTRHNAKGEAVETKTYTPQSFAADYGTPELVTDYIMIMNDPSRPYYQTYDIEQDRHLYEGRSWLYVNLPMDEIKQMAISSLSDSTAMYFSCDVGKQLDRERGLLDVKNYDYNALFGMSFDMDKAHRIASRASGSSHAMTLVAVDIRDNVPVKWKVENSWGAAHGAAGFLIMTDEWFNEYMFRLVIDRKYATEATLKAMKTKPVRLPVWDPMFQSEL